MGTGDSPEMQRMQDEAIERAREMRRRAQLPPTEEGIPNERSAEIAADQSIAAAVPSASADDPISHDPPDSVPSAEEASDQHPVHDDASNPAIKPLPSMLDNLFKNHEQTLILILLILIGGESQNHELMFALLFLLM